MHARPSGASTAEYSALMLLLSLVAGLVIAVSMCLV